MNQKLILTPKELEDFKKLKDQKEAELTYVRYQLSSCLDEYDYGRLNSKAKELASDINKLERVLKFSELNKDTISDNVRVGDLLWLSFNGEEPELSKLVVEAQQVMESNYIQISINSPVGAAIFNQPIGNTVQAKNGMIIEIKERAEIEENKLER